MSVTSPKGFVATGVHCGIRKNEKRDLAIVRSLEPATGAGMFTINRLQAAPVTVCKEHLAGAQPQAVVVNSGNANAATGANGIAHDFAPLIGGYNDGEGCVAHRRLAGSKGLRRCFEEEIKVANMAGPGALTAMHSATNGRRSLFARVPTDLAAMAKRP